MKCTKSGLKNHRKKTIFAAFTAWSTQMFVEKVILILTKCKYFPNNFTQQWCIIKKPICTCSVFKHPSKYHRINVLIYIKMFNDHFNKNNFCQVQHSCSLKVHLYRREKWCLSCLRSSLESTWLGKASTARLAAL